MLKKLEIDLKVWDLKKEYTVYYRSIVYSSLQMWVFISMCRVTGGGIHYFTGEMCRWAWLTHQSLLCSNPAFLPSSLVGTPSLVVKASLLDEPYKENKYLPNAYYIYNIYIIRIRFLELFSLQVVTSGIFSHLAMEKIATCRWFTNHIHMAMGHWKAWLRDKLPETIPSCANFHKAFSVIRSICWKSIDYWFLAFMVIGVYKYNHSGIGNNQSIVQPPAASCMGPKIDSDFSSVPLV